jgi:hypothetical protein
MLRAFAEDREIHQATAAEVFSLPLDGVADIRLRFAGYHTRIFPNVQPFADAACASHANVSKTCRTLTA